jgi:galactonate dehydratase
MKIADLKTFVIGVPPPGRGGRNWVFVKLTTDNGIYGWGEAFGVPFDPHLVAKLIESIGEQLVIGTDPFAIELMWRKMYAYGYDQHPDLTKVSIISAFEIACWDIIGKATGQPVYNLLGGRYHEGLRSYTYLYPAASQPGMFGVQANPQAAAERAVEYMKRGFKGVKVDPVGVGSAYAPYQLSLETLSLTEAVIGAIREAVGDKCDILLGTHGQMTTSSAIRLAKQVEKYRPLWFEEPVPPENRDEMGALARSTSIPVSAGERLSTKYEFLELCQKRAASILQPALGRVGGILEAKKIAGMAEAFYVQIAPHLYSGPVEAAANIHLDTCSPNFLIQESIEDFSGFHSEILKKPIRWEEGYIIPPTEPGLGIDLNEEVIARHPYNGNTPAIGNADSQQSVLKALRPMK